MPDDWYSNDTATFGDRVAGARDALGMDQKTLARRLGVGLKTIDNWEHDLAEPRANRLQMLAGILNVSMRWLLTGEGDSPAESGGAPDANVTEILSEMRALRVQIRHAAERMAVLEKRLATACGGGA